MDSKFQFLVGRTIETVKKSGSWLLVDFTDSTSCMIADRGLIPLSNESNHTVVHDEPEAA